MTPAMFHVKQRDFGTPNGVWQGSNRGQTRIKTARTALWMVASGVMLAACSSPEDMAEKTAAAAPGAPATAAAPPAPPTPAPAKVDFTDNAKQGTGKDAPSRDFAYSWPSAVSAVPELAARFTAERDELLADQKGEWTDSLKEFAGQDCFSCVNRDFQKTWEVVADLPRYLSLSAGFYEYSGGAHGNHGSQALVWDREAKTAFDPKALFRSEAALQDALGAAWCKALKAERAKRLGPDFSDDGFFPCPQIAELTVLVGSSNKQSFNRIGLIADPYVAGPYVEGSYELTFPVTPKVLAAVKPEFKAAFALGK